MNTSTTLRQLNGLEAAPATLANATLILVDYQNTYTRGVMELTGWKAALASASELLGRARAAGAKVIHVVHDGGKGSPYDLDDEVGKIHSMVAPIEGEPIVVKTAPNAFFNTDLGERVDAAGNKQVIVIGFMTHMCVTFTAEGAFLRGNQPTVVANACATRPIRTHVVDVSAETLHESALATIADLYAVVARSGSSLC
ncbi:cysteine hydrolase [Paraburkholderia sp. Ac-20342]|uniref:cysteine hydrolase family protein n=1 Tax=Paraburkholderia sp. Ac-20342 TaxID=2703889 RepID=UPI00197E6CC5|nr:cysteine hydrolase family protein [Paraburkholderia sp. Ac-20342]MBN3848834.1 cysteine hydrolase [Paraburkholderia sp. Ac-20342]